MEKFLAVVGLFVSAIVLVMIMATILAVPTMFLWNWLMPVIFNLPQITFWQSLGLMLLSALLFKSSHVNTSRN